MTAFLEKLALWWTSTSTPTKIAVLAVIASGLVVGTVWLT